jgi:exodeoxyribonuclease V alpha subunit
MKIEPKPSDREVLAGLVERVTYHNAENGFCVLRARARGHRDVVTVVGHAATISAGEWITASGEWVNDRTHGQQFKARFLRTSPPTSADGIEKYLSSGMMPSRSCPRTRIGSRAIFVALVSRPPTRSP